MGKASWHLAVLSLLYRIANSIYLAVTVLLCKILCSHSIVSEESSPPSGIWCCVRRVVNIMKDCWEWLIQQYSIAS